MQEISNPFISIIIPFYNSEKYLDRSIKSVIEQKNNEYELILVNDGSTDKSKEIALKYVECNSNIHYVESVGNGVSNARNIGIDRSRGTYIAFLDSDDEIMDDFLDEVYSFLIKRKVDILFFNFYEINNEKKILNKIKLQSPIEKVEVNTAINTVLSNNGYKGFCWDKIYKRSVIKKIEFKNDIFYLEDMIFNIDVLKHSENVYFIDKPLYKYYWRMDSTVNQFNRKQLTYLKALDYLLDELPLEFQADILLKKKIAYINFSSLVFFRDRDLFKDLKYKFNNTRINSFQGTSISKIDYFIIKIGQVNFTLSAICFMIKRKMLKSDIFLYVKSKIRNKGEEFN